MSSLGETDEVPQRQQEGAIVTLVLGLSEENGGRIQSPQAGGLNGQCIRGSPGKEAWESALAFPCMHLGRPLPLLGSLSLQRQGEGPR